MLQNFSADPMALRERDDYKNVRIAYMRWQLFRVF